MATTNTHLADSPRVQTPSKHSKTDAASSGEAASADAIPPLAPPAITDGQRNAAGSEEEAKVSLSDFEVLRTLGTGSYGRVLLVKDLKLGQYYAMKRLKKAEIVRLKQVEHTNNERRLLHLVSGSPFIVSLKTSFQDARYLYLLLEYVPGGELFGLLRRVQSLPHFVAQFYAAEIITVLSALHARDIIYRDLKPENVLIGADGHLRLADFGFAKVVPDITWTFCGTPEYLAPELVSATGTGYSKSVDWYALGVLIYEMLYGYPPFYHENHLKLYDQIVNRDVSFPPGADPIAVDLMSGLLEKNPTRRLGCGKGGADEVKGHRWFIDIAWKYLANRQVKPPYKPKVSSPGDASNFDRYPEDSDEPVGAAEADEYGRLFPDFHYLT